MLLMVFVMCMCHTLACKATTAVYVMAIDERTMLRKVKEY